MRLKRWMCLALLSLAAAGCASVPPGTVPHPATSSLLVTNIRLIDLEDGQVGAPQDLLIEAGRIAIIAPAGAISVAADVPQLDGAGHYALPGLIDVHAHVGEGGIGPQDDASRARALNQFLRYGVTSIFVPGATGAGDADFPRLRSRCRSGALACPDLFGSGSILTAPGSHPVSTIFDLPEDVAPAVTEPLGVTVIRPDADLHGLIAAKAGAGLDAIKIVVEDGPPPWHPRPRLSDAQIERIATAADRHSLPVFAHVSGSMLARSAVENGVDGIMHAPTDAMPESLLRLMAERRAWYVPTFSLYDGILTWTRAGRVSDPYAIAGVEPSAMESLTNAGFLFAAPESEEQALGYLRHASDNLRRAAAAGVPIALGSDVNNPFVFPGFSTHQELAWMVEAGLSPLAALRAATSSGAAFLRADDRIGRIAPGFEADLLLLARNPLENIRNSRSIVTVIADGRLIRDVVAPH